ncbi:vacuolar amino acid permease [Mycena pura]|uniref:Vacuolar amino acid permease n=1 Tax=Mycena pura TaxID=153505 RepID=A0AAD6YKM8_9AGAR|nr:vacuolar amino acid permease [Mycena pura]
MATAPTERDPLIRKPLASAESAAPDTKQRPGPLEISARNRRGILAGIWLASFLGSLNLTLVPTMMPSISSEFQKFHQASWLGTAYLLATCTFTPLYGRLCNVMGRRGANHTAIVFAAAGTIGCGLSRNMEMLIFFRFIAGIGGGGLFTTSTIIVSDMYTLRDRGLIQGLASCCNGFGMGLGGPFGGLITDLLGWRAAFLLQIPIFLAAFFITQYNLRYATPGKSKGAREVLKRIDYLGSLTLLISVGSLLVFLSSRYNEGFPWLDTRVIVPLVLAAVFFFTFLGVEIFVAPEPVMAPAMLRQKIPVLVSASNFLVAACNFSVTYFFPMWFQVVTLQSASTAGLHLMPNSISMSTGSLFAGYVMHRTGRYKTINLIFGFFPFIGAVLISLMRQDSGPIQSWLSIIPLGFGNAVVLQTMLIALLAHLPESQMAVGTGFGQLFRGIGQVGGVAIASAIFQSRLDTELRRRIHTPDAEELIMKIRRSSAFIRELNPDLQRDARESYAIGLRTVYIFAACSTFLAYCVRLPVCYVLGVQSIPDQDLDKAHAKRRRSAALPASAPVQGNDGAIAGPSLSSSPLDSESPTETETEHDEGERVARPRPRPGIGRNHRRRLSGFESMDGGLDLESETVGGSARAPVSSPRVAN